MTSEATILPGSQPIYDGAADCRGDANGKRCPALVHKPVKEDTLKAWHAALKSGQEATAAYLKKFNAKVEHRNGCRFRNLPPSVHHWARSPERGYNDLLGEAERVKDMGHLP